MKKKILLVDDKSTIGKVAGVYLGKEYDFTYLEDPIKAIEWLNEGNVPDLIISDIRMPLMMGDEFLRYMKNNELFKSIPIVMLSRNHSTHWNSKSESKRLLTNTGSSTHAIFCLYRQR